MEPVTFTLSIFDALTRMLPNAWRTLGYVKNLDLIKYNSPFEKIQDYHAIIGIIMQQVETVQTNGGLKWQFSGHKFKVTLKMPVMWLLGDTEGQDKLCGRWSNRTHAKHLCRYCNIPREKTDDPFAKSKYIKQNAIMKLLKSKKNEKLKEMAYYPGLNNFLHNLQFCETDRGIHGATPFEIVHTIQLGWHIYLLNAFFRQKKCMRMTNKMKLANKKLNAQKNDYVSSQILASKTQEDLSTFNVFNEEFSKLFEARVKQYGKILQNQSDRNLPRLYFPQGIIPSKHKMKKEGKKFSAHEHQGVIILVLFVICSEKYYYFAEQMGSDRIALFLSTFEKVILLENFLQQEEIPFEAIDLIREYMPSLMDLFKRTINRCEGMGCKFVKFHFLQHLADDIERNGVCSNTSSGPGESRHKQACKRPAKNTQRIADKFEMQLGKQYADALVIDRGALDILKTKEVQKLNSNHLKLEAPRFIMLDEDIMDLKSRKWNKTTGTWKYNDTKQWFDEQMKRDIIDFMISHVNGHIYYEETIFYTKLVKNKTIYRANPMYKNERAWHDWVDITCSKTNTLVPAQLLVFLKIETLSSPIQYGDLFNINEPGIYALVHKVPASLDSKPTWTTRYGDNHKAHQESMLFYYSEKMLTRTRKKIPQIFLINVESINGPCIAVPDLDNTKHKYSYIFMKNKASWMNIFLDHMKNHKENSNHKTYGSNTNKNSNDNNSQNSASDNSE